MLTLKSLSFGGIGRFVTPQTIDFTQLGPLIQLDGQNLNTSGSSGSGKSTLIRALEFLFGLNSISNNILQSRLTKESMWVCGEFDLDGAPLKIERGKKYLIDWNGVVTTGSSKLTDEVLEKIIGMPSDLFRKILHKRQGEGGFFLDMGPTKIHEFMTSCQGLDKEREKLIPLDKRISKSEETVKSLKSSIASMDIGLEATQNAINSLGSKPEVTIIQALVDKFQAEHVEFENKLSEIENSQKFEMEELNKQRPQISFAPFDRSKITALENEIQLLQTEISSLDMKEAERSWGILKKIDLIKSEISKHEYNIKEGARVLKEVDSIVLQIQKIKENMCPTCDQCWINEKARAKETELMGKVASYKAAVIQGKKSEQEIVALKESLPALQEESKARPTGAEPMKAVLDTKNKELDGLRQEERKHQSAEKIKSQAILDQFTTREKELRTKHDSVSKALRADVSVALDSYNKILNERKAQVEAVKRYESSSLQLATQLESYKQKKSDYTAKLVAEKETLDLDLETKKVVKSYLSCTFDGALEAIGNSATELIRGIPNMRNATIQLEGLKENKDGKVKEEVNAIISMDGEIGVPIKSLSGGERSSTDLAIDLAVIQFIEERTGKGINVMFLDEPFTGMDFECSSNAVEMLKLVQGNKKLILVDHNPQLKELIGTNSITVIRDGLTSTVEIKV